MTDTSDNQILSAAINSPAFQDRCRLRFIVAAIAVAAEVGTQTTNALTAAANNTLHFAATPAFVAVGMTAADLTIPAAIPANTTVLSKTATTVVMSANAFSQVGSGDTISFSPVSHTQRMALSGAILAGTVDVRTLCMLILASTPVRTAVLADPTQAGGSALDSDIDNQVSGVFTGVALSRSW